MPRGPNGPDERSPSSCWVPFEELRVERLGRASRSAPGPLEMSLPGRAPTMPLRTPSGPPPGPARQREVRVACVPQRDRHKRADHGYAQGLADLAGGRGNCCGNARLGTGHPRNGGIGDRRVHKAEPDPEDHVGGEQPGERRRWAQPHQHEAGGAESQASDDQGDPSPCLPTIRPDKGGKSMVIAAIGSVSSPACNGESPRTSWR